MRIEECFQSAVRQVVATHANDVNKTVCLFPQSIYKVGTQKITGLLTGHDRYFQWPAGCAHPCSSFLTTDRLYEEPLVVCLGHSLTEAEDKCSTRFNRDPGKTGISGILHRGDPDSWQVCPLILPGLRHFNKDAATSRNSPYSAQFTHTFNHLIGAFGTFKGDHTATDSDCALPDIQITQTERRFHRKPHIVAFALIRHRSRKDRRRKRRKKVRHHLMSPDNLEPERLQKADKGPQ